MTRPDGKLTSLAELLSIRAGLRAADRTIVFTNGCFDLLHAGHVHVLTEARRLGDTLIVGLNSDASVTRLKGAGRPADRLGTRITNLAALSSVDYIIVYEQDTPTTLLEQIRPDILVKGGDYSLDQIVGREMVESYGGRVRTVPFLEGYSTTRTLGTQRA